MFGITLTPQLLKIVGFVALAVALFFGFEYAQHEADQRGYVRAQSEYDKKALKASEAARIKERDLQNQLQEAQNEARKREADLNLAANAARTERDGLRDELASISDRLSKASADSLRQYARTANAVLKECTDRYTELAAKADGHASDALMLAQGWPK
jgi:hypothetical protein